MERKITEVFEKWKKDPNKVGLIVEGARQVGKTYIIREFGKNYENFLEINLIEKKDDIDIFSGNLDAGTVMGKLNARFPEFRIVKGKSLLFLDEIQDCPEAITAIKPLVDDGRLDIIASGSMLGIQYKGPKSYPVGYVHTVRMHPMDFEEFLIAKGVGRETIDSVRKNISGKRPFDPSVLKTFDDYFRQYMQVGGMPRAVSTYLDETKQMDDVYRVQDDIIQAYRKDIASYASRKDVGDITRAFEMIPTELGRPSKRFRFGDVSEDSQGRYESFKGPLDWITGSRFIEVCGSIRSIEHPLNAQREERKFKTYLDDTGLLMQMYGKETRIAIMDADMAVNEGAVTENIVLQMLASSDLPVYYYEKNNTTDDEMKGNADIEGKMSEKEKKVRMEIDFITSFDADIVAIEVKSGKKRKAKSIKTLMETDYGKNVRRFIRLAHSNISVDEFGIEHYPIFCAAFTDAMFVKKNLGK